LVSGHLSHDHPVPSRSAVPTSLTPLICPVCTHVRTIAGQAYADAIHDCDVALAFCHSNSLVDGGDVAPLSLCAILDFASLAAFGSFLHSIPTWSSADQSTLLLGPYTVAQKIVPMFA
jgi:hypothetical protein